MKTFLTLLLTTLVMSLGIPSAKADSIHEQQLTKKIESIARKAVPSGGVDSHEEVTIHFLINAQHELVIFNISGENEVMCERVKEILNYRKVKIKQARQLVPYEINIRFVPDQTQRA